MIAYVISMLLYNVAADNVLRCGQAVTLSVGKGGEITTRTGTLAGDYHNDTRWDHQEL